MSIELTMAAEAAVGLVAPYLAEAGKEAAKTVGKEGASAALGLLDWLRDKLTGRAQEALIDLQTDPTSSDNQADLRKQLAKLLASHPELLPEMRALLPATVALSDTMQQRVEGAEAKGSQIKGNQNTVNM